MTKYSSEIIKSMNFLSTKKNTIFLGQSVVYPGNLLYKTLKQIDKNKKIELPVFEDIQMGLSLGMSINGIYPITCYPRFDFLILAMNQLVNHADKLKIITLEQYLPKMIIRVLVGAKKPLDGGEQHTQNYVKTIKKMFKTIKVYDLKNEKLIYKSYKEAFENKKINLMVEYSENY
jgi:pyruvate/2-oxoglutarate/acetoin dehydrogenase E1 component